MKVAQLCPTFCDPWTIQSVEFSRPDLYTVHGILQARILEGGSLSLLQGIFPTQRSNPGLLHCGQILYHLSHKGSPRILQWVTYPFSRRPSWPRNSTMVSCIPGTFFTNWNIREYLLQAHTFNKYFLDENSVYKHTFFHTMSRGFFLTLSRGFFLLVTLTTDGSLPNSRSSSIHDMLTFSLLYVSATWFLRLLLASYYMVSHPSFLVTGHWMTNGMGNLPEILQRKEKRKHK